MAKNKNTSKTSAPGTRLYVICESGFEYNDEIYHKPECNGGQPVAVFSNEALAKKACQERNLKSILGEWDNLQSYFYDISDSFSDEAVELLEKYGKGDASMAFNASWQIIPPEDLQKIVDGCNISWYEVYEVEDVDTSGS